MRSKELRLVQENHATVKPDSSVSPHETQSQVNFYHQSSPAIRKKLWRCLEYWKHPRKLVVAVNLEAIWFEFWMKGALVTVEIFLLCGWRFSNQFDIVVETHFSCDTAGLELWLAMLCPLLCPETDWNIRIGNQGYVFILIDYKKWCCGVSFLTSISLNGHFEKVEFFK